MARVSTTRPATGDGPGDGSEAYNQSNFRTCGGKNSLAGGELKKGAPTRRRSADAAPTPASIPSKLETILFRGEREHKGFGSHALRFPTAQGGELPGPGAYAAPKAFHEESGARDSWGVRGTGGFASKSRRFRSLPPGAGGGRGGPGPGQYEQLQQPEANMQVPSASKPGLPSSAFAQPMSVNPQRFFPKPTPGPGQYNSPREKWGGLERFVKPSSAFKSETKRGFAAASRSAEFAGPGPGAYDVAEVSTAFRDESLSESFRPASVPPDRGCQNRMFKGPTQRRLVSVHPDMPVPSHLSEADQRGDFVRQCKGSSQANPNPPPGHYTPDDSTITQPQNFSSMGSSMFQEGNSHQPRSRRDVMPGPGQYMGLVDRQEPRGGGAGSAFKSASMRDKDFVPTAPGPAFYKMPPPEAKKTFHLNMRRKWI